MNSHNTNEEAINIPKQSPLFHALNESRYIRQKKIMEIESITGRKLIVYIATLDQVGQMFHNDIVPFGDLLEEPTDKLDLMLQSPGGDTDAAEKILLLCRSRSKEFRVIIPDCAKSAATLVALGADTVLMGDTSEMGPIDPQIQLIQANGTPRWYAAQSIIDGLNGIIQLCKNDRDLIYPYTPLLDQLHPALLDQCEKYILRSKIMALVWLQKYMLKDEENDQKAIAIADSLGDARQHLSHNRILNHEWARDMGVKVEYLPADDRVWKAIWRLYCDYHVGMGSYKFVKIFESDRVSIPLFTG